MINHIMKVAVSAALLAALLISVKPENEMSCRTRTDYRTDNKVLYYASDISQENIDTETAIYNRLPEGIRQALINIGFSYYLINENNDRTDSGHTGTTHFRWTTGSTTYDQCWAEGRMQADIKYNGDVMNHEVGHMIDSMYLGTGPASGDASGAQEWKDLYARYKDTISGFGGLSKYEVYNSAEAFAESYAHVTNNRRMVLERAPEIVGYIDKVNADVINRYGDVGERENTGTEFNAQIYYNRYPDLQEAFGYDEAKLYEHWLTFGIKEGRKAS